MKAFIHSASSISCQESFADDAFLQPARWIEGNRMLAKEPDYSSIFDAKQIRRMSRIIRMGAATALNALKRSGITNPDAIVMGTAYGCLEDTVLFLNKMVDNQEQMLTPTAFIQSTHNTVAAQIALILKCHSYNNTFVHRGFSFESALLDALMLLAEGDAEQVLVGAADEITNESHAILERFGLYKKGSGGNKELFNTGTRGTVAGEGASFFLLSAKPGHEPMASIDGMHTFYAPTSHGQAIDDIKRWMTTEGLSIDEGDLVLIGKNGDAKADAFYDLVKSAVFPRNNCIYFKQACGEYPTVSSFALWLAANIISKQALPLFLSANAPVKMPLKRIWIYNHYLLQHHSLFLLSAC